MTKEKAAAVIGKRRDWLRKRISQSGKDLSYDRAEFSALEVAITVLNEPERPANGAGSVEDDRVVRRR